MRLEGMGAGRFPGAVSLAKNNEKEFWLWASRFFTEHSGTKTLSPRPNQAHWKRTTQFLLFGMTLGICITLVLAITTH